MAILHLAQELSVVVGVSLMDRHHHFANLCCAGLNPSVCANGKILHTIAPAADDHKTGVIIRVASTKSCNKRGEDMSNLKKKKSTS
jgi:hypothetical protein